MLLCIYRYWYSPQVLDGSFHGRDAHEVPKPESCNVVSAGLYDGMQRIEDSLLGAFDCKLLGADWSLPAHRSSSVTMSFAGSSVNMSYSVSPYLVPKLIRQSIPFRLVNSRSNHALCSAPENDLYHFCTL